METAKLNLLLLWISTITNVVVPAPILKFVPGHILDMSYSFDNNTQYWVQEEMRGGSFNLTVIFDQNVTIGDNGETFYLNNKKYAAPEHGGTHIDAPLHFKENGQSTDQIPIEQILGPAYRIDVADKVGDNGHYEVTLEDVLEFEEKNEPIAPNSIALIYTGWGRHYGNPEKYVGVSREKYLKTGTLDGIRYPSIRPEATAYLVYNRSIITLGIDTVSPDNLIHMPKSH